MDSKPGPILMQFMIALIVGSSISSRDKKRDEQTCKRIPVRTLDQHRRGNNEQNSELIIASTGPIPSGVQDSKQSTMPSESKLTQVQQEYRT